MQPTLGVGIFSGLNITELVSGLLSVERQPLQLMTVKQSSNDAKISALGSLKSSLSSLASSLDQLKSDSFLSMKASSSNGDIFTATADSKALSGRYSIKVARLATSQTLVSDPFAKFSSEVADLSVYNSQKITLQVGGQSKEITIDSSNNTLEGLRNEINESGLAMQASIVNYGFSIDATNQDLLFSVDGVNKTASLTQGSYTADELAAELTRAMQAANDNNDTYTVSFDSSTHKFSIGNDNGNIADLDILAEDGASTLTALIGLNTTDHTVLTPGQSLEADSPVGGNRLVITSLETGSDSRIQILVDEDNDGTYEGPGDTDNSGLSRIAFNPLYDVNGNITAGTQNLQQTQAALDALLAVNGIDASRSTNIIDDLIPNVSLNIKKVDVSSNVDLVVERDLGSVVNKIKSFVAAYNDVAGLARGLSEVRDDQRALLTGDSVIRGMLNQMRNSLIGRFGDFSAAQLGLSHDENGMLSLDESIISGYLDTDFAAVQKSLGAFSESLQDGINGFINTSIPTRIDGLEAANKRLLENMDSLQRRLILKEDVLIERFSILEQTLGQLQSSSDFLTQQLANIASISNSGGNKS